MIKINTKKFALAFAVAITITTSCKKDFQQINTNPNGVVAALPENLLQPALYEVVTRGNNRAHRLTHELMQVHVTLSDGDDLQRYLIRPSESDYIWTNWYLQLKNFRDMYSRAVSVNQTQYQGIALICDVWVSSMITDAFGDVPYFDASKGQEGVLQPKFDKQQDIYLDMFKKLEQANTLLAATTSATVTVDQLPLDPLFGTNSGATVANSTGLWRKFGNSLYLRLLMRASAKAEANAAVKMQEIVSDATKYPIMTSNAESAIVKYTGSTVPLINPFYNVRDFDFTTGNSLTEFFINTLNNWNDPRRAKWATQVAGGTYVGVPSGFPRGQVPEKQSAYPTTLKVEPLVGNIMNYAELQFILAEAALKGYITGDPATYYNNGVNNAVTMWGYTVPTGYLTNPALAWNPAGTADAKLEQIMIQKYYTFFFTDLQSWFEFRRTGHPVLPKGSGLQNGGLMPSRLYYPVYVQSLNPANYTAAVAQQGADNLNTKVWWNK
ncbi:SusD/RagB family nutrient-binding outer membrane lipoprotein [Mucilaginibacter myungsuensis]|uniref:SusD/RagB family nutrient-binding outer membrane lipoprotein n=1 Tax=Mucilaginibacter myungsuensis TaxID=649104 RepID=A0A929PVZ3_9SPHI|nr:SusD/RagB family nutrient-binding outer membrane lipoprotein [Mucilaginibacter myungsuensis]MBE9661536.1 SusD/RagB family nutrient-binding outer membrane lipoprotein [Mucilaginibacter myungsuensis]MDN3597679.1 SusD/RagB family nutrient-binding outer membrane lipoprotein [Mucilaginibacter myungsuensis]